VKIGKSVSEMLALLIVAYGEVSVSEWHKQFEDGQEDVLVVQEHACMLLRSQGDR
jgi:hypothetical protein